MNIRKQKITTILLALVVLFIVSTSLGAAAPIGTTEGKTVQCAYNWAGTPYVYGGNTTRGIDCSHLVCRVYQQAGAYYPHYLTVAGIKASLGKYYSKTTSPRPGDIILWEQDVNGYDFSKHVGIYIGNGQFIHASYTAGKVVVDSLSNSKYYPGNTIMQAKPFYARWVYSLV
jgi:peptidoglycan endopeptidase LytE